MSSYLPAHLLRAHPTFPPFYLTQGWGPSVFLFQRVEGPKHDRFFAFLTVALYCASLSLNRVTSYCTNKNVYYYLLYLKYRYPLKLTILQTFNCKQNRNALVFLHCCQYIVLFLMSMYRYRYPCIPCIGRSGFCNTVCLCIVFIPCINPPAVLYAVHAYCRSSCAVPYCTALVFMQHALIFLHCWPLTGPIAVFSVFQTLVLLQCHPSLVFL